MKSLILALSLMLFGATISNAQAPTKLCFPNVNGGCQDVDATNPLPVTSSGSGAGATQVQGAAASGSATVGNPVLIGGSYNTTLPTFSNSTATVIQTDNRGNLRSQLILIGSSAVDNVTNSALGLGNAATSVQGDGRYLGVYPYIFNGSTWDRKFTCTNTVAINASGVTQLVALTSNQTIRVCSFAVSAAEEASFRFTTGTGTNCGTGTVNLTGDMVLGRYSSFGLTNSVNSIFRGNLSAALCIVPSGSTVTGFITYAKY